MAKLFGILGIVVGVLLAIIPLIAGYVPIRIIVDAVCAAIVIVGSAVIYGAKNKSAVATGGKLLVVLGVLAVAWSIAVPFVTGERFGILEFLMGIILIGAGAIMPLFSLEATKAAFFNSTGSEMARLTKVYVKNDQLRAGMTLLGTMPETVYVRPEELVNAINMVNFDVIKVLPGMLREGFKQVKEASKE